MVQFSKKRRFDQIALRRWGFVLLLLLIGGGFVMLREEPEVKLDFELDPNHIYCDAEKIYHTKNGPRFIGGNYQFRNAHTQSADFSRSGKHSSKLIKGRKFGIAFDIQDVQGGESYIASVWRYTKNGNGRLIAAPKWGKIHKASEPKEKDKDGWDQLVVHLIVPDSIKNGFLKFYCWYPEQEPDDSVYFDDFVIERIGSGPNANSNAMKKLAKELDDQLKLSLAPIPKLSIKAYKQEQQEKQLILAVKNFYPDTVHILGLGKSRKEVRYEPESPVFLAPDQGESPPRFRELHFPGGHGAKFIFFKVPKMEETYIEEILPWSYPKAESPRQKLFKNLQISTNDLYTVSENEIKFRKGYLNTDVDVLIPAGYQVFFPAACTLSLSNKAKFVSYSPVQMEGTESAPILIVSPDSSANGFTLIQPGDTSRISHTTFRGLNTLDYQNWFLTGAVTFYEAPVILANCTISRNQCEDALNTIRTWFEVKDSQIEYALRDGFDSDYCEGTITNSTFFHTGNDAMDFSGSTITIESCIINHAGDKGISVGEQATIRIISVVVNDAEIGVASKDLSELTIDWININGCKLGFAAYQKKPEYGPASIIVKDYKESDLGRIHKIEEGSYLKLGEVDIRGEVGG